MTPEEAFLQAVIESPDDDGPRLMYADWLEERGDPRGEFIRVQLELARLPEDDDRRAELAARERQLLASHADKWSAPVGPWVLHDAFRRGFPDRVGVDCTPLDDATGWRTEVQRLLEVAPVRELVLFPFRGGGWAHRVGLELAWLARSPLLARIAGLKLYWAEDPPEPDRDGDIATGVCALAATPYATRLESLDLASSPLGINGAAALAGSNQFPHLRRLNLAHTNLDASVFGRLAAGPLAGQLTHLDCSENAGLTAAVVRAFLDAPTLSSLTHLAVGVVGFGQDGVQPLIGSPRLGELVHLRLCDAPSARRTHEPDLRELVHPATALAALLGLRSLVRLRELSLEGLWVGRLGLEKFLDGSACSVLRLLALDRCGLADDVVPQLQALLNRGRLRRLSLRINRLTDRGVVGLARCPGLARLHELDLRGNDLTPAGRHAIETSPHRHRWLHLLA